MRAFNDASILVFRSAILFYEYKKQTILCFFVVCYAGIFACFLSYYYITDFVIYCALLLSPFIVSPHSARDAGSKYLWLTLSFVLLALLSGTITIYFIALGMAVLYAIESIAGNIGYLPIFLLGLLSPAFKYFNNIAGFPVRLKLSEWAGIILQGLGYKIEVTGNLIIMNGTEFSVDPACAGLKMMAISLLAGLFILAFFQRRRVNPFSWLVVAGVLLLIIGLNIIANLTRILLLTMLKILPDNPSHDFVGILCLIIYVILPSYFIIHWLANKAALKSSTSGATQKKLSQILFFNSILLVAVFLTGFIRRMEPEPTSISKMSMQGYRKEILNDGILKFEKPGILLYWKRLQHFYGAEHNPMICWVGSGYVFKQIKKQILGNKEIYLGTLKKGNDLLYSAWWFDNGHYQTIRQSDWRWRAFRGEEFYLVNISSGNEETLRKEIVRLLSGLSSLPISEHAFSISEHGKHISEHAKSFSEDSYAISEGSATISEHGNCISEHSEATLGSSNRSPKVPDAARVSENAAPMAENRSMEAENRSRRVPEASIDRNIRLRRRKTDL
jgi:exosortase N